MYLVTQTRGSVLLGEPSKRFGTFFKHLRTNAQDCLTGTVVINRNPLPKNIELWWIHCFPISTTLCPRGWGRPFPFSNLCSAAACAGSGSGSSKCPCSVKREAYDFHYNISRLFYKTRRGYLHIVGRVRRCGICQPERSSLTPHCVLPEKSRLTLPAIIMWCAISFLPIEYPYRKFHGSNTSAWNRVGYSLRSCLVCGQAGNGCSSHLLHSIPKI